MTDLLPVKLPEYNRFVRALIKHSDKWSVVNKAIKAWNTRTERGE